MRKPGLAAAVAAVALALLAAAGRAERARWVDDQRAGIGSAVDGAGGRFLTPRLSDVWDDRLRPGVTCLRYAGGGDPYALQLCFDPRGRVTEAYDERSGTIEIYDLHAEPDQSGYRIDPRRLRQIRRYVITTQDEIRRAEIRALKLRALRKK